MKKIVFTGGGTLGHVMPNIYIMDELKDWKITYIGTNGIEKDRIKKCNADYKTITATKLVRGKILSNLKIPFVLIKSIHQAKSILKDVKPNIIFSKGGYVSLPVCIAGKMLKIPIVAHESDYSMGLANKIILKLCNVMCVNFDNFHGKENKIVYTGPIFSKSFESKAKHLNNINLDENKPTILIVSGSLGSTKINQTFFSIIDVLIKDFNIIHITGKGNCNVKSHKNYNSMELTNDMVSLYNACDFVVGRSGAGITGESFFKQKPMLLIPLENAASRGDQVLNANYYKNLGVAEIIREADLSPELLLKTINAFSKSLSDIKKTYKKLANPNGLMQVLKIINTYSKD